ncbi:hypothetical protein QN386_06960 [Pseudomonas sp. CCI3.2]|uniref:hypothetical protein n=1 Tax=unclassified Pseudomonas TaxID=196821 RepID=UPI002B235F51|nr:MULTISPECIES: hypothetical protein [unclassified Pseudomonas]MEB0076295.1 hypothetical protein [Pseudomonas sp. MH10out]MEB0101066.1 hypothetical protein [Pseudomonas sp. CCI3.2]MEB0128925.1 hypothetical protein [Pseudomonas sp. CCI2.4]
MKQSNPDTTLDARGTALCPLVKKLAIKHGHIAVIRGEVKRCGPRDFGLYQLRTKGGQVVAGQFFELDADAIFAYFGEPLPEVGL